MKNIHVLPTDKPSRLQLQMNGNFYIENGKSIALRSYQHIYITNDEEIKEGDYYITPNNTILKALGSMVINVEDYKKIILTTDYSLAPDVQKIDDEFLEWFVNNPSCEEIIVTNLYGDFNPIEYYYETLIPKEKPEQELERGITITHIGKPKQETLEEAAKNYAIDNSLIGYESMPYKGFLEGAKCQQERLCDSEVIQRIRASKSNAEARRIIRTI